MQVDSFPGANFLHILKILQNQQPHPHVLAAIVVLSVGLNNRAQHPKETAIKQLQGLWRMAHEIYKNAMVYSPLFSIQIF